MLVTQSTAGNIVDIFMPLVTITIKYLITNLGSTECVTDKYIKITLCFIL